MAYLSRKGVKVLFFPLEINRVTLSVQGLSLNDVKMTCSSDPLGFLCDGIPCGFRFSDFPGIFEIVAVSTSLLLKGLKG